MNAEDEFKSVAPTLMRAIRKALGLSQERMAYRIGVSRQMVNYYERGSSYPPVEVWLRWKDAVVKEIGKKGGK